MYRVLRRVYKWTVPLIEVASIVMFIALCVTALGQPKNCINRTTLQESLTRSVLLAHGPLDYLHLKICSKESSFV